MRIYIRFYSTFRSYLNTKAVSIDISDDSTVYRLIKFLRTKIKKNVKNHFFDNEELNDILFVLNGMVLKPQQLNKKLKENDILDILKINLGG